MEYGKRKEQTMLKDVSISFTYPLFLFPQLLFFTSPRYVQICECIIIVTLLFSHVPHSIANRTCQIAYKHQLRALARWPKDPLRPDIQFQDVIRRRIDRRLGLAGPEADRDSKSSSPVASNWNETQELEQANALYGLVGNRYLQKVSSSPTSTYIYLFIGL